MGTYRDYRDEERRVRAALQARHPDLSITTINLFTELAAIRPPDSFEVDGVWYHPPEKIVGRRHPGTFFTIRDDVGCMKYRWTPEVEHL